MSQRTLPLLVFNLGGEMLYILHQRLHSQNVVTEKTAKVLQDMVVAMFQEQWLEEVFRPKPIFTRSALLDLLKRVAHSSIMRLSDAAMDKLYDLVTMAFKYQLMACPRPEDMILITFNHLDTIKSLISESRKCTDMINSACRKLNEYYSSLPAAEFIHLRSTMLSFLQDSQKRITVLMRQGMQHQNGLFVIPMKGPVPTGFEPPGTIRYYSEEGDVSETEHFPTVHKFQPPLRQGSWETVGDRVTSLGLNIYQKDAGSRPKPKRTEESVVGERGAHENTKRGRKPVTDSTSSREYREEQYEEEGKVSKTVENVELSLLHRLLIPAQSSREPTFRLNLFPDLELDDDDDDHGGGDRDTEEELISSRSKDNILQLETNKKGADELDKIKKDFTSTAKGSPAAPDDDLLDLLDQAVAG